MPILKPGMETQHREAAPANPPAPDQVAAMGAVNPSGWRQKHGAGGALALVALVVAAYWPSFRGGFVWDDLVLVKQNPLASGELNWVTIWGKTDFPLSMVILWWEWLGFGTNATGYRIVNVLLHIASVLLGWRIGTRLKLPGAWIGAALFAVHPVAVASVAWISELKNTLSLPLFLLSTLALVRLSEDSKDLSPRQKLALYAGALIAFLLALLAKTSAVVLPALLLIGLWWRGQVSRWNVIALVPFFATSLLFGLRTIWFQSNQAIRDVVVQTGGFPERMADAGTAIWFYLGKTLWPTNLCAIYPSWNEALPGPLRYAPLVSFLAALAAAWFFRARIGCSAGFGLLMFATAFFPAWGLFDMYFMVFARVSDHFAYLPLLAVTGIAGAKLGQIHNPKLARGVTLFVLTGLFTITFNRSSVYATDERLWRDTVQKNPDAWIAHNNLACNLAERGKLSEAIGHFQKSLTINPRNAAAQLNLGRALTLTGQLEQAEAHFAAALQIKPDDVEILSTYAGALAQNRQLAAAEKLFRKLVELKPTAKHHAQLAAILAGTGQCSEAIHAYRAVLALDPTSIEALNNLAWILANTPDKKLRDGHAAMRLAQDACRLTNFQQPTVLGTLATAQAEVGDFTNALLTAQAAIDLSKATGNPAFAQRMEQLKRLFQSNRAVPTTNQP